MKKDYSIKQHRVRAGYSRGPQRGRLHLHNMVTLFLYGKPHCFKTRDDAIKWIQEAMASCDVGSSEFKGTATQSSTAFSRYADVWQQIQENPDQHTFRECT